MAANNLELVCIGNALVDIFVRGDMQAGIREGLTRPVQHMEIERLRKILSAFPDHTIISGGGAANVAKIAAFLGARVSFIGALGTEKSDDAEAFHPDRFGQTFEKSLFSAGVKLRLSLKPSSTGVCLYFNTGNEIRIAASPCAALLLSESDIRDEDLERAGIVVIDGFMLDRPTLVRNLLHRTDQYGKAAAIDLGSAAIAREQAAEIAGFARRYSLILFMNEAEADAFYEGLGSPGDGEGGGAGLLPFMTERRSAAGFRFRYICSFFRSLTKGEFFPVIVVKLESRGALVFAGGSIHRAETTPVSPLETTGAGDAFSAAFLTAWVRNKPLPECAALGNKAARIILDVTGTLANRKQFRSIAQELK